MAKGVRFRRLLWDSCAPHAGKTMAGWCFMNQTLHYVDGTAELCSGAPCSEFVAALNQGFLPSRKPGQNRQELAPKQGLRARFPGPLPTPATSVAITVWGKGYSVSPLTFPWKSVQMRRQINGKSESQHKLQPIQFPHYRAKG